MGFAGCGKSTLGIELARVLGRPLIEGDEFHPSANVAKMRSGIPLDDADRHGWLEALEPPLAETGVLALDATLPLAELTQRVLEWLATPA